MVARSSPPDTPARPCGACTAARSGPSRCWSWSWTAGERCRGLRGGPRAAASQRAPRRQRRPCPGSLWGGVGGWDEGILLAPGAPFCPWGLFLGSPLLSLGVVSGRYSRDRPRGPWELSLGSPPLSPGCLRDVQVGSSFSVSRLGSGGRRGLCLPCRSRGLNDLRGLSVPSGPAALRWLWVTGRAINRELWLRAVS